MKRTGPTNYQLKVLLEELKKKAIADKAGVWKKIATDLEKPSRQRRVVNLSRVNVNAVEGQILVVPGKLLGDGDLDKKVSVAAFAISQSAKDKVLEAKGEVLSIEELLKKNPKASTLRILG